MWPFTTANPFHAVSPLRVMDRKPEPKPDPKPPRRKHCDKCGLYAPPLDENRLCAKCGKKVN